MRYGSWAVVVTSVVLLGLAPAQERKDDRAKVVHLLQRATWGARPADVEQVLQLGRARWLDQQLHPERLADASAAQRLAPFDVLAADMGDLLREFQAAQRERRELAQRSPQLNLDSMAPAQRLVLLDSVRRSSGRELTRQQRRARLRISPPYVLTQLVSAKLIRAVHSERQLEEVMTDFWFNHFNVFFGKAVTRYMMADYERNAIRPHVFGNFRDLLGATAKHPAMLFYLDNAQSVSIDTMRLRRIPAPMRGRGLNENYARELLELHTLGVDGGYTQQDVIEVARAFTGWQFTRPGGAGASDGDVAFVFRPMLHDRGEKIVLGRRLPAGRGIEDGEAVLDLLAGHPSTARHIASKLAQRFVSDEPPSELVDELAQVFARTQGDLREVTRALFMSKWFSDAPARRAKIKSPFELVASALRLTGAEVGLSRAAVQALRTLGQLPYNEPAPTGFPAASEEWVNSGAMLNRMNFALALAANRLDGIVLPSGDYNDTSALLQRLMPGVDTRRLEQTIRTELEQSRRGPGAALALVLGSPEFQRK